MLTVLMEIAEEAGALIAEEAGNIHDNAIIMKSDKDMVTEIDIKVQNFIHEKTKRSFPDAQFWGEENTAPPEDSDREVIIVDPIDGTNNFIHGLPFYNISIAYRKDGSTRYGVVYAPALRDMYYSEAGKGAYKNKTRIQVSRKEKLDECVGISGFAALRSGISPNNVALFPLVIQKLQSVRIHGASALDLCFVAEGRCDLLWYFNLNPWDTAAGELILREAGGTVSDFQGGREHESKRQIAASNGFVHDEFLSLLKSCSAEY